MLLERRKQNKIEKGKGRLDTHPVLSRSQTGIRRFPDGTGRQRICRILKPVTEPAQQRRGNPYETSGRSTAAHHVPAV